MVLNPGLSPGDEDWEGDCCSVVCPGVERESGLKGEVVEGPGTVLEGELEFGWSEGGGSEERSR
jgi:hypothetical protein